jgi:hypothetical protein
MTRQSILFFILMGSSMLVAAPSKDPQIIVEPDQTDVFAIPLDEDAQDQQEELESLEHPNKK